MRAFTTEIQSTGDYRQHARSMNALGSEISNVGGENTKCDLNWTVVDPMFDKVHDLADHQSDQKAHSDQIRQAQ